MMKNLPDHAELLMEKITFARKLLTQIDRRTGFLFPHVSQELVLLTVSFNHDAKKEINATRKVHKGFGNRDKKEIRDKYRADQEYFENYVLSHLPKNRFPAMITYCPDGDFLTNLGFKLLKGAVCLLPTQKTRVLRPHVFNPSGDRYNIEAHPIETFVEKQHDRCTVILERCEPDPVTFWSPAHHTHMYPGSPRIARFPRFFHFDMCLRFVSEWMQDAYVEAGKTLDWGEFRNWPDGRYPLSGEVYAQGVNYDQREGWITYFKRTYDMLNRQSITDTRINVSNYLDEMRGRLYSNILDLLEEYRQSFDKAYEGYFETRRNISLCAQYTHRWLPNHWRLLEEFYQTCPFYDVTRATEDSDTAESAEDT